MHSVLDGVIMNAIQRIAIVIMTGTAGSAIRNLPIVAGLRRIGIIFVVTGGRKVLARRRAKGRKRLSA